MKAIADVYSVSGAPKAPVAVTGTFTSAAIDFANAIENMIVINPGLWTDGTYTFSFTDSADNTTYAANTTDLVYQSGNTAFNVISSTATALVQKFSYIGSKRYGKVVCTVATATTGAVLSILSMLRVHKQPTA